MPVFDQGYQHWSGNLASHAWRWLAVTRHGLRIAFSGRYLRLVLLIAWLPAIVLAAMLCLWGLLESQSELIATFQPLLGFLDPAMLADPREYRLVFWTLCYSYFMSAELSFSMLLIVLVGPNLISQDLRYNALPLYFSRPLRRVDYFLGKLGVIVALLAMVMIVPAVVAYVLGLLFSLEFSIVRDTYGLLLASVGYGLVISVSAGLLILALSSLSRNSRYVALFWLGLWFVTGIAAFVLQTAEMEQRRHHAFQHESAALADLPAQQLEAARRDWRPLVSYTANLSRIGQWLLGADAVWERLSQLRPERQRAQFLLDYSGPKYPWYWSAAVLAGLAGLSLCILNYSIKSLDRLK